MPSSSLPPPSPDEVHVWQWDLDAPGGDFERHWQTLSAQERERAGQFRFEQHRRRYVAGRAELRRLLGRYLAIPAHAVALGTGAEGKPFCATQPAGWQLRFNLSHTANAAALAVANGFEVGIDVENLRPIEDCVPLEVFTARELATYRALTPAQQHAVFFETWARKEAGLKALGTGFVLPPGHFEFDLSIHGDTTPRLVGGEAREAAQWRIRALPFHAARAGAVAARRTDWSIVNMN
ncbi:4'-phosphopantetheinyl transferase family protein [Paraburkholderia sp. J41]|uniref:4'-phosphopantetheinyl transferase family protein n=1 Tax=Paraburkholderia sp. J41 TaxID=2805433 RepID=UPI002AC357A3|nr:4'-phosphopantetheinyl transferase superfamily protein [Paraburkholderia sp. J41]